MSVAFIHCSIKNKGEKINSFEKNKREKTQGDKINSLKNKTRRKDCLLNLKKK